jgi:hypothetical protein
MKKKPARHPLEVSPDKLRWQCLPQQLGIGTMDEVKPL